MLKAVKDCIPWFHWQLGAIAALVIVGIVICTDLPKLSFLAGATPLLLIAVCLLPCLLSLAFLRKKSGAPAVAVDDQQK